MAPGAWQEDHRGAFREGRKHICFEQFVVITYACETRTFETAIAIKQVNMGTGWGIATFVF